MDDVQLEYLVEDVLDLDDVDEIQGRKSRKSKYGFGLRPIGRHSLFDRVTDLLSSQAYIPRTESRLPRMIISALAYSRSMMKWSSVIGGYILRLVRSVSSTRIFLCR
jgi:hypothetical protein